MWPFRKKPREVEMTLTEYRLWLRAGSPPFQWFMEQSIDVQQALAALGDAHAQDAALGLVTMLRDPELAATAPGSEEREELLLGRLLQGVAVGAAAPRAKPAAPAPTMGGITERREAQDAAQKRAKLAGRSFLGRQPKGAPA